MAQALIAAMPPNLDLDLGCQIVFEAIDPTSGDPVTGVLIGDALIRIEANFDTGGDLSPLASGPFMLVPGPAA